MRASAVVLPSIVALLAGCGPDLQDAYFESISSDLSASQRRARAEAIRDTAAARGLDNGALLGGIGDAETGLAHCWSEATWACQGPSSPSCGGGPVIAGAGDGPCSLREGGLGLFQFDGGTFDQTLARDGQGVLLLEGNVSHAVDFVIAMVIRSSFIEGVDDEAGALAFMNAVPMQPGDARYEAWVSTVTRHYNGCSPSSSCWGPRRGRYGSLTTGIYDEMGADFWGQVTPPPPPPPCLPVPPEGRVIEEDDACYRRGGAESGWRAVTDGGSGGRLQWTYATAAALDNFGEWAIEVAEAGIYRVEVYSDGGTYFQSRRAVYTVVHDGITEDRVLDQTSGAGFLPLGELRFAAGGGQSVRLGDDTGEPYADRVRLGFDAIRLVRVDGAPEPVEPPVEEPPVEEVPPVVVEEGAGEVAEGEGPNAAAEEPIDGEVGGGCQCVAPVSRGPGMVVLAVVVMGWVRARRRA